MRDAIRPRYETGDLAEGWPLTHARQHGGNFVSWLFGQLIKADCPRVEAWRSSRLEAADWQPRPPDPFCQPVCWPIPDSAAFLCLLTTEDPAAQQRAGSQDYSSRRDLAAIC